MQRIFGMMALCIFVYASLFSQNYVPSDSNKLKVGDKVPNVILGEIMNDGEESPRFSNFEGRLLILDFWDTHCVSCIQAFPEMERLQSKFADKIQILLVNAKETRQEINSWIDTLKAHKLNIPRLPIIANASNLGKLFPHHWVGHHVWIDGQGFVRLIGSNLNTHENKIKDLLAGNTIRFMPDENNSINIFMNDKQASLIEALGMRRDSSLSFNSLFTRFQNDINPYGGYLEGDIDKAFRTKRSTYINKDITELYDFALKHEISWSSKKLLGPSNQGRMDVFLLFVGDTTTYTCAFMENKNDEDWCRSHYCYEQITPDFVDDNIRRKYMLQDLNRYFGIQYGTFGRVERVNMPCWVLVRTSKIDKIKAKDEEFLVYDIIVQNRKMKKYNNILLKHVISSSLIDLYRNNGKSRPLILDETGYAEMISIVLPKWEEHNTLQDFRVSLKKYDLDIIPTVRNLKMIVLQEQNVNNKNTTN